MKTKLVNMITFRVKIRLRLELKIDDNPSPAWKALAHKQDTNFYSSGSALPGS